MISELVIQLGENQGISGKDRRKRKKKRNSIKKPEPYIRPLQIDAVHRTCRQTEK